MADLFSKGPTRNGRGSRYVDTSLNIRLLIGHTNVNRGQVTGMC
jgi:hypothetical protein